MVLHRFDYNYTVVILKCECNRIRRSLNWGQVMALLLVLLAIAPARAAGPPAHYTVQTDDTLPRLAEKYYHDVQSWPAIWQANQANPGETAPASPYLLRPGQRLRLPRPDQLDQLLAEYAAANGPPPALQPVSLSAGWLAEFSAYVDEARQHFEIPGAAVAVVRPSQILLAQGFGVKELGKNEPVNPKTIFGIGSTTKAMTALLVASLVDDGRLDWDEPVMELWPDFALSDPTVTPQITLRDLLSMRSGLPRADLVWSGSGMTAEAVMQSLATLPVLAPPGQRFEYNNQAVATAGFVATLAAGGKFGALGPTYTTLMQQRVFNPIGMSSATFNAAAVQVHPNHATPHDFLLSGETVPTYFHTDPGIDPAGGVNANIIDLARFVQTQLARGVSPAGRRVVSAKNLTETWQPQMELYPGNNYATGWFVEEYRGVTMIWHDGDVLGFKSLLVLLPEANVGLALLSNRTVSYGFSNSVRYHFVEQIYGLNADAGQFYRDQWTTFITTGLPNARAPLDPSPPPAEVRAYLGRYEAGWQVEQHSDGTVWAIRGDYRWQLWADAGTGKFVVGNGFGLLTPLEFTHEDGDIVMQFELATGEQGMYRKE